MSDRLIVRKAAPEGYQKLRDLSSYLSGCGLEPQLLHLVYLRASQLNHCAYCTDMHWKDARQGGDTEQRLSLVSVWREYAGFTEREKAAFAWTEAVTKLHSIPTELFEATRLHFSDTELANLTLAIGTINLWNRLGVAFQLTPGIYQPSQH
ncbi:carboxymuconolactone decarboxylase family protein [Bryobacter aggregatus]|uniref:carboxymuconolactone decarboxylase family protein n=1 Tax=Bryobacter aggregatus TaxID=360054 RepID=UPI0004E1BE28|nr:carboxymuconolactone decarboxylase family protein [Bryobacter aggregatus]